MCGAWKSKALAAWVATALLAGAAEGRPITWVRTGDALTLDPHSQNEGPTHNLLQQIYEPLILREYTGKLLPTLAVSWKVTDDPSVWEFKLRQGVRFHNGDPFDADDVVFSIERALQPTSDMKALLSSVEAVTKVDDYTVHFKTMGPNPILPEQLTTIYIMDKEWSEANNTVTVEDYKSRKDNFAARNANGTGPYVVVSREQDVRTVLKLFDGYWGKGQVPLGIETITYVTIKKDETRVAALLSGEVDFVQDMPVQDIERVQKTPGLRVNLGQENRSIFLGMDVGSADLKSDDVQGKNPFADKRVRQAINVAIDRDGIRRAVMRNQSKPSGMIIGPFVNGYNEELGKAPAVNVDKAKALLAEAGYANGFSIAFHCPNDRYVSDEGICQAIVPMLARIGIKANLISQSKTKHFPTLQNGESEFYLLGWGVPTYDSEYAFSFLHHTRTGRYGVWNLTRYSNPELDKRIEALSSEIDIAKRNAAIGEIWKTLQDETIYIPLHDQLLAYAMKSDLDVPVSPDNWVHMKFAAPKKYGGSATSDRDTTTWPSEPVLSVRNLEVAFLGRRGKLVAVDGVSFDIAAGEVLGVVGESGAGKSLTGAAVIGLLEPPGRITGGEVWLGAQRIDNAPPDEMRKIRGARIGMVFQDPLTSLNPLYRIGDQIVETIRTHKPVSQARRASEAIALLEVGIRGAGAHRPIRTSSPAACAGAWYWR
jgi:peptide/nickel transport system substrate-binding protein